ncbi:hypothetical protein GCM10014719_65280 [Planomonospora parontospora subsp. antibiotica]|nr:hypothetical protein GCM10014719_65280 [Planomonospora parontospora subsp. antibiotica]
MPACSARDDLLLIAVELGANAVRHTASGNGGQFVIEVTWSGALVRVAVIDGGATGEPHLVDDPMAEHGRGLRLVRDLSKRMGMSGDARGRTVWAQIGWDGPQAAPPLRSPADTATIAAGQAELARRFTGVIAWFDLSTRQWWALARRPGADCLLTAPSVPALAELLNQQRRSA